MANSQWKYQTNIFHWLQRKIIKKETKFNDRKLYKPKFKQQKRMKRKDSVLNLDANQRNN